MRTQALVALFVVTVVSPALAQGSAEQEIRALIQKDATSRTDDLFQPDALWWTGATAHPHRVNEPDAVVDRDNITVAGRKNVKFTVQPDRITVSGDMAMEYSTFTLAYDDNEGHKNVTGAMLRVWQRQNGAWKIAANFQRPYGRVVAVGQSGSPK
jgi:ketosteroid isomerase-like protein